MRTTVDLDDALFRKAKAHAALQGIPLRELMERGVRLALQTPEPAKKQYRVKFPLFDRKECKPVPIPADIVHRMDQQEDRERHESSL